MGLGRLVKKIRGKLFSNSEEVSNPEGMHNFMGYDIPVSLMLLTGGGPETFDEISSSHIENLKRWVGLEKSHTVLEIGCGIGRDAIPLTKILSEGSYTGVDIIKPSIDWCQQNIAAKNPNFKFLFYNVEDQLHNSDGVISTTDIVLPIEDQSVDRIIVFSVFTHMFKPAIEHYLKEFKRLLKPGGLVYATTFLFNDDILKSARKTNLTPFDLRFDHEYEPGCRINDPAYPLGAVAYSIESWDKMIEKTGLNYAMSPLKGAWSGFYDIPDDGQDVVVLTTQ